MAKIASLPHAAGRGRLRAFWLGLLRWVGDHRLALLAAALVVSPCASRAGSRLIDAGSIEPWSTTLARDGNFYGTVAIGSTQRGYVYSISPSVTLRKFGSFPVLSDLWLPSSIGSEPEGKLGVGQDGSIYGKTRRGGAFAGGVLFRIDPLGRYKILHHFETLGAGIPDYNPPLTGAVLATEAGEIFASAQQRDVLRLERDGAYRIIPLPETIFSLLETADHEILAGSSNLHPPASGAPWVPNGKLWKLAETGEFEERADVGAQPHTLVPLSTGGALCLTSNRLLEVSPQGEVSVLHEFNLAFQGTSPTSVVIAQDGSYLGTTKAGGLDNGGVIFRFVPGSGSYAVVKHLSTGGQFGPTRSWMESFYPLLTKIAAGNHPPMAKDDIIAATRLKSIDGSLPRVTVPVLNNDRDVDHDRLTIVAITPAAHGIASFDFVSQTITYEANSGEVENDSFTYRITDGSGGTGTAHVVIQTSPTGRYEGTVYAVDPSQPGVGSGPHGILQIDVAANRVFRGQLIVGDWVYRFSGQFNERNQYGSIIHVAPRIGRVPIQLWLHPDGSAWTIEANLQDGVFYSAHCAGG